MKTLIHIWLLTSLMYLPILPCMAQQSKALNHFDANIGLSTADATNVGVRYNFKQNSIGINIGGGIPSRQAWQIISSVSVYRHLWGNSKFTEVMPWYLKAGVHFDYSESHLTPGRTQAVRQA